MDVALLNLKNATVPRLKNWPKVHHNSQAMLKLSILEASLDSTAKAEAQQVYEIGAYTV